MSDLRCVKTTKIFKILSRFVVRGKTKYFNNQLMIDPMNFNQSILDSEQQ